MSYRRQCFAALWLLVAWTPADAEETHRDMAAPALPPCTCRAQGRDFDMGEEACLATPDGPRLAVCAMDQNVSSWKTTARPCPSASRRGAAA